MMYEIMQRAFSRRKQIRIQSLAVQDLYRSDAMCQTK